MKIEINEMVLLSNSEIETIKKARQIIEQITDGLTECTAFIDDQSFPDDIEALIKAVLNLENKKIYSIFNCMGNEERLAFTKILKR